MVTHACLLCVVGCPTMVLTLSSHPAQPRKRSTMKSNYIFQESIANDDDWSHFQDTDVDETYISSQSESSHCILPPPQLHPAVSLGMQKVNSCYFSIGSAPTHESMASFAEAVQGELLEYETESNRSLQMESSDILYHDVLMNTFTFLDAQSLAAFSETAKRPNFEVFYFLQLQLQRALLVESSKTSDNASPTSCNLHQDHLTTIAGSSFLSRLATMDPERAQNIVKEFLESNSTLRTMPLSHSIAYMRHFLQQNGFHNQFKLEATKHPSPSQALASAALLATVVGAAYISGEMLEIPTELPNMLFRFGFVGSLMGAARHKMADHPEQQQQQSEHTQFRLPSLFEMKETLTATLSNHHHQQRRETSPMLSNPYDHIKSNDKGLSEEEKKHDSPESSSSSSSSSTMDTYNRKMPSGCVGAYSRAIQSATNYISNIVKESRKAKFMALSEIERRERVISFFDACSTDNLAVVQIIIPIMDVGSFHVGSDGSETCALHTAAFHGAAKVLNYLLGGIDDGTDSVRDGGLCNVNCRDSNGWTALHFAAGANAVKSIQVLARHGADLSIEANNGYSPLQWASRLSNEQASDMLKELINNESDRSIRWISSQPLTTIVNRFFSFIPTQ
jgi:hypothetical protein